jgi:hypothetical protein
MTTLCFIIGVGVCVHALAADLAKIARWAPVRWFFEGLFGGLGVRASGVLRRPRNRHLRHVFDDDEGPSVPPRKRARTTPRPPPLPSSPNDTEVSQRASLAASDTVSALINLGYKRREALAAAKSAQAALDHGAPVAALIRYALASLSNRKVA